MITIIFTKPVLRFISVFLTVLMVSQFLVPLSMYALTSGPTQPEFSSFEPVATTNMVDNFTGAFNYNLPVIEIPGPHGSSYPLSLSYHSGASPEDEASWVGYGWNINPGAINRNVRGYPDDDLGVKIDKYMNSGTDYTFSLGGRVAPEASSTKIIGIGGTVSLRFNNHKGYALGLGIDANFAGYGSVSFNVDDGNSSFSAAIDPWKCLNLDKTGTKKGMSEEGVLNYLVRETKKAAITSVFSYAADLLSSQSYATPMQEYSGVNVNARIGGTTSVSWPPWAPAGINTGGVGTYSSYKLKDRYLSAYGYMYSGVAQIRRLLEDEGKENGNSISMDYYKERYAPFQKHQKYLPIPFNNPDNYSVSGEGVGGNFRFHHREIGSNLPEYSSSKKDELGMSIEITTGLEWGVSPEVNLGETSSTVKSSTEGDSFLNDQSTVKKYSTDAEYRNINLHPSVIPILNTKDEGVFPRFSGDLGGCVVFDQNLGTLSSPSFDKVNTPNNFSGSGNNINKMNAGERSGRSSNISYNTIGSMKAYPEFCYTKDKGTRDQVIFPLGDPHDPHTIDPDEFELEKNHLPDNAIGEFAVYLPDGRCYVYGLPVLARKEEKRNLINKKNGENNSTGEYREAPYATKYLLTQILSSDYVDMGADGPTEDDLGGWVKFSYKKCTVDTDPDLIDVGTWSKWRIPFSKGSYNHENNKIFDEEDDADSYAQGEKQTYVLEKVETATHIAFFVTNKTNTTYHVTPEVDVEIKGSQRERADAYQYEYSNGTYAAYFGKWGLEADGWPVNASMTAHKILNNGANEYYQAGYQLLKNQVAGDGVTTVKYPNFSENLERIELYKKGDGQQIKTVRFDYDYSTYAADYIPGPMNCTDYYGHFPQYSEQAKSEFQMQDFCLTNPNALFTYYNFPPPGIPNCAMYPTRNGVNPQHASVVRVARYGKLTLKKVWFEYGGILNAKISPYVFEYAYPSTTVSDADLNAKYPNYLNYGTNLTTPPFVEQAQDAWGYYSEDPYALYWKNYYSRAWLSQKSNNIDPAPYYLKVIKLPSGGEIRVQYEGHDYEYVQNRPAMAMVSLYAVQNKDGSSNVDFTKGRYYLDVDANFDADALSGTENKNNFLLKLQDQFVGLGKEKIAFKFLCSYNSNEQASLNETDYWSLSQPKLNREYIQGYSSVETVGIDQGKFYFDLKGDDTPITIAKEYYTTHISGKENSLKDGNVLDNIQSLAGKFTFLNSTPNVRIFNKFSYFRIPLPQPKRAGGSRVKRILMYDRGDQSSENNEGGAVIYGQEYIYKTLITNKNANAPVDQKQLLISSGVATNEPSEMRVENSLVGFLENYLDPGWAAKPIAGKNIDNYEGPLGESILPGAAIGYSKVIVKNIHSGKTTPGFTVHDFYTYKDAPFLNDKEEEQFSIMDKHQAETPIHSPLPMLSIDVFGESMSQGYRFSINSMHGQPRKTTQYSWGLDSDFDVKDLYNIEKSTPVENVEYEYFGQKELIPLFFDENTAIKNSLNGIEMDISHEANVFTEERKSLGAEVDFGMGPSHCPPPAGTIPCIAFYFNVGGVNAAYRRLKLECNVMSKVIRYPVILKKVTTKRDGMVHIVENIAFSPYTGQPSVRMVTDEFDGTKPENALSTLTGTTTIFEIPAASKYKEMGQKSENERFALKSASYDFTAVKEPNMLDNPDILLRIKQPNSPLYPGDIIMFLKTVNGHDEYLQSMIVDNIANINTNPIGSMGTNLNYYIRRLRNDIGGSPITYLTNFPHNHGNKMVVIRSGKTNQLSAVGASISLYGKTKEEILDPNTTLATLASNGVLSASATKYSGEWNYTWAEPGGVQNDNYQTGGTSDIENGRKGKWRPAETYVYREETKVAVGGTNRIYSSAGSTANSPTVNPFPSPMLDWRLVDNYNNGSSIINDPRWLRTNSITHYSKHGEPVEEMGINNISSAARFSHKDAVPSMIASNSKYLDMFFESYEDQEGSDIIQTKAHTGNNSRILTGGTTSQAELPKIQDAGEYLIKLWVTMENAPSVVGSGGMNKVCRSGAWVLFEKTITVSAGSTPTIEFNCSGMDTQFLDDVRIQPKESQSTCYVYDNRNLRLLAQFDDQHFASIFQYNSEGKLLRKLKETTRGIKTIAETDYLTPTTQRPEDNVGSGVARYETTTMMKAGPTSNPKSKDTYVKDNLDSKKIKDTKGVIYQDMNSRVTNMQLRKKGQVVDTLGNFKFDFMNIHATPEQLNAKIIGADTIKIEKQKNKDKR